MFPFIARLFCTLALLISSITLITSAHAAGPYDGPWTGMAGNFFRDCSAHEQKISAAVSNGILKFEIEKKNGKKKLINLAIDASGKATEEMIWRTAGGYTTVSLSIRIKGQFSPNYFFGSVSSNHKSGHRCMFNIILIPGTQKITTRYERFAEIALENNNIQTATAHETPPATVDTTNISTASVSNKNNLDGEWVGKLHGGGRCVFTSIPLSMTISNGKYNLRFNTGGKTKSDINLYGPIEASTNSISQRDLLKTDNGKIFVHDAFGNMQRAKDYSFKAELINGEIFGKIEITQKKYLRTTCFATLNLKHINSAVATIQTNPSVASVQNIPTTVVTDTTAPVIVIASEWETTSSVVKLSGQIQDASQIMELTINGLPAQVGEGGSFTANRGAMAGTSQIVLLATDVWGNQSEKTISVTRKVVLSTVESNDNNATADDLSNLLYGNYYALVIGNNDYEGLPKLATAVADARSVAEVLHRNYRYDVELLINATRRDVFKAFSNLNRKLKANDNLLVYYAGHGYLDAELDKGYWLPVDADRDFKSDWISNADITDAIRVINSNHIMIVADSCFSGSLVRNVNMNTASNQNRKVLLERLIGKKSRTVMTSGGLEPVADGGGDGHSVFARAFLDVLIENDTVIEGQEFFTRIRNKVITNANQTPEYSDVRMSGHDGGDFIFVRRNP